MNSNDDISEHDIGKDRIKAYKGLNREELEFIMAATRPSKVYSIKELVNNFMRDLKKHKGVMNERKNRRNRR